MTTTKKIVLLIVAMLMIITAVGLKYYNIQKENTLNNNISGELPDVSNENFISNAGDMKMGDTVINHLNSGEIAELINKAEYDVTDKKRTQLEKLKMGQSYSTNLNGKNIRIETEIYNKRIEISSSGMSIDYFYDVLFNYNLKLVMDDTEISLLSGDGYIASSNMENYPVLSGDHYIDETTMSEECEILYSNIDNYEIKIGTLRDSKTGKQYLIICDENDEMGNKFYLIDSSGCFYEWKSSSWVYGAAVKLNEDGKYEYSSDEVMFFEDEIVFFDIYAEFKNKDGIATVKDEFDRTFKRDRPSTQDAVHRLYIEDGVLKDEIVKIYDDVAYGCEQDW